MSIREKSNQLDESGVGDLQTCLLNTKMYLLQSQQYFLQQPPESEPNLQISEALSAIEQALQGLSAQAES